MDELKHGSRLAPVILVFLAVTALSQQYVAQVPQSSVDFGNDSSRWSQDGECDDPRFEGPGVSEFPEEADLRRDATDCRELFRQGQIRLKLPVAPVPGRESQREERGRLELGDATLRSGEYRDTFTFQGRSGEQVVVDVRSAEFDTYLIVAAPDGTQQDNDDFEADGHRSALSLTLDQTGSFNVFVTSYAPGETGEYTLTIAQTENRDPATLEERGSLAAGDNTMRSGEFVDEYEFAGRPGQRAILSLQSADFDTYLILVSPSGQQIEDDDSGETGQSALTSRLDELGTYRVLVTSYEPGETGSYRLRVERSMEDADSGPAPGRDVVPLTVGRATTGVLEASDLQLSSGEFQDIYAFEGTAGQAIHVEVTSTDFDTYVAVVPPEGAVIENDDFLGSSQRSVVDLTLDQTGRYRVIATSRAARETGAYRLTVSGRAREGLAPKQWDGQIYGVFVGISDYPGSDLDLRYTAEDAARVRDSLIRGAGMSAGNAVTLADSKATIGNLRQAIRDFASRLGPNDTFVLFYSGHGSQMSRPSGPDSADPDGFDETLELYDGPVLDDELRTMLDQLKAGATLIVLDSCFSGGFAKDIISVPGRMGLFSSEEDVTSQVAFKFRAGGYLSAFFDEAIGDGQADENPDGMVTAIELSQYIHDRYRNDVKSSGARDFVRTGGPQTGYQHLVVDRGSIAPSDILFKRRAS